MKKYFALILFFQYIYIRNIIKFSMDVCVAVYVCELLHSPALDSVRDWFLKSGFLWLAMV